MRAGGYLDDGGLVVHGHGDGSKPGLLRRGLDALHRERLCTARSVCQLEGPEGVFHRADALGREEGLVGVQSGKN